MRNYNKINWNEINNQLKQAKEEYWGCFNFSNYGLTEIPTEIFEIDSLCELDLSYNRFQDIPSDISKLTNLSYLILDSNKITTLPKDLIQLTNLYEIYLEENDLVSIPSIVFEILSL
ncbi:MAG: leucine-rich repeat domain-containing protein, partial [Cyanobacteria bacterium P01_A01_bin.68]